MSKTAVYPGSFDPITNGHVDIIERAAQVFDKVVVAVAHNPEKRALFSVEERVAMIVEACRHLPNVSVAQFDGLTADFVRQQEATVLVRGLRAISDFEFELQMALMNKKLNPDLETMFMMTSAEWLFLSSSVVREIARFGGCVEGMVPPHVVGKLREKFALAKEAEGRAVP
ncbi:MAG: pantetheine-phosphate adenylyltransferase [Abditibacteriales bacterium]|nr:pantetheine-phosphate adenylyltransferase [Abditibacteriales bacterium]MDW8366179.1 pantetheine-phosphate adenylyltransferase [Abditibacteriales bacterium]